MASVCGAVTVAPTAGSRSQPPQLRFVVVVDYERLVVTVLGDLRRIESGLHHRDDGDHLCLIDIQLRRDSLVGMPRGSHRFPAVAARS